jgi:hypothetical protein
VAGAVVEDAVFQRQQVVLVGFGYLPADRQLFGAVAELLQRVCLEVAGRLVVGLSEARWLTTSATQR